MAYEGSAFLHRSLGEMGVLDHIPPNAVITAEVTVLANRSDPSAGYVSETGRPPV